MRKSLPLALVVALVLAVGSIGAATAGPALTKKAVKKIATKVVQKQAPGLSVANAQTLAGQPAATYRTRGYHFTIAATTMSPAARTYPLTGVAAGTYAASFNVTAQMDTATNPLQCWFQGAAEFPRLGWSIGSNNSVLSVASGSTVLTFDGSTPLVFKCAGTTGPMQITSGTSPAEVTLVRIDDLATGALTEAP